MRPVRSLGAEGQFVRRGGRKAFHPWVSEGWVCSFWPWGGSSLVGCALAQRSDGKYGGLHACKLPVCIVPIHVVELREIVRIANVLIREVRQNSTSEGDDLFRLEAFGFFEDGKHVFERWEVDGGRVRHDETL